MAQLATSIQGNTRLLPMPSADAFRSICRSLLREASYLPDPIARRYMHDHIIHRFRGYNPKPPHKCVESISETRQIRLLKAARKHLGLLTQANQGYVKTLERVLMLSYGRIGRRKHDLLEPLLDPHIDPPKIDKDTGEMIPRVAHTLTAPMHALVQSQSTNPILREKKMLSKVKTECEIPKETAMGRPMPLTRQLAIRRQWYRRVMEQVFPPLPPNEVELLKGLISRRIRWELPTRRARPQDREAPDSSASSINARSLAEGPQKGPTFESYARGRPHIITRRLMTRVWRNLLMTIPDLSWNASTQRWQVQWPNFIGTQPAPYTELEARRDESTLRFLKGVDKDGRLISD